MHALADDNEFGHEGAALIALPLDDLPVGRAKGFELGDGRRIFVVRTVAGIYAYDDICPHLGRTRLPWKADEYLTGDGAWIRCASHNALFDIATGSCIDGVCLGKKLKALKVVISNSSNHTVVIYGGGKNL